MDLSLCLWVPRGHESRDPAANPTLLPPFSFWRQRQRQAKAEQFWWVSAAKAARSWDTDLNLPASVSHGICRISPGSEPWVGAGHSREERGFSIISPRLGCSGSPCDQHRKQQGLGLFREQRLCRHLNVMCFLKPLQGPGCHTSDPADAAHAAPENIPLGNTVSVQGPAPTPSRSQLLGQGVRVGNKPSTTKLSFGTLGVRGSFPEPQQSLKQIPDAFLRTTCVGVAALGGDAECFVRYLCSLASCPTTRPAASASTSTALRPRAGPSALTARACAAPVLPAAVTAPQPCPCPQL